MIRFVGDVHAKFDRYLEVVAPAEESIQVGDFGAGFKPMPDLGPRHRFIRGNHDNPEVCRSHANWLADGSHERGMFFLGGASSIDAAQRTEGVDWWRDEELGYGELMAALDAYETVKPRIMVTHDCPDTMTGILFPKHYKLDDSSRTRSALDAFLDVHWPEIWVFGHWHRDVDMVYNRTRFICLAELSFIDLDV